MKWPWQQTGREWLLDIKRAWEGEPTKAAFDPARAHAMRATHSRLQVAIAFADWSRAAEIVDENPEAVWPGIRDYVYRKRAMAVLAKLGDDVVSVAEGEPDWWRKRWHGINWAALDRDEFELLRPLFPQAIWPGIKAYRGQQVEQQERCYTWIDPWAYG